MNHMNREVRMADEGFVAHTIDLDLIRKSREHYGSIRDTNWEDFGMRPDESGLYTHGWRG